MTTRRHGLNDEPLEVIRGSGNVFADLGFFDAEERLVKARLGMQISDAIRRRRLSRAKVSALLGIDALDLIRLLRGGLSEFSTERLAIFINLLATKQ